MSNLALPVYVLLKGTEYRQVFWREEDAVRFLSQQPDKESLSIEEVRPLGPKKEKKKKLKKRLSSTLQKLLEDSSDEKEEKPEPVKVTVKRQPSERALKGLRDSGRINTWVTGPFK